MSTWAGTSTKRPRPKSGSFMLDWVGLSRQLSNPTNALERLLNRSGVSSGSLTRSRQARGWGEDSTRDISSDAVQLYGLKRLKPQDIAGIVARYKGGENTANLAEQFQVNRRTISEVLNQKNVVRRARPLTERQIDQAVLHTKRGSPSRRSGM